MARESGETNEGFFREVGGRESIMFNDELEPRRLLHRMAKEVPRTGGVGGEPTSMDCTK